jgi:hypothetical protein
MMSPAADPQEDVEKIAGGPSTALASGIERQQQTSLPPSFDDPTADGRTATSSEPQSSLDKMHEQSAAILDHEVAHDEAIVRRHSPSVGWRRSQLVPITAYSMSVDADPARPANCLLPYRLRRTSTYGT